MRTNNTGYEYGGLIFIGTDRKATIEECQNIIYPQNPSGTNGQYHYNIAAGLLNLDNYQINGKKYVSVWHSHPTRDQSQWPSGISRDVPYGDAYLFLNMVGYTWSSTYLEGQQGIHCNRLPGRVGIVAGPFGVSIFRFFGSAYYPVSGNDNYGNPLGCKPPNSDYCFKKEDQINYKRNFCWITWNMNEINFESDEQ